MTKRIKAYMTYIDQILEKNETGLSYETIIAEHEKQLAFFMHERLVHLLVMLSFAIFTFGVFIANCFAFSISLTILFFALMVLLVPYVMHYFLLENSCQYMYRQYDKLQQFVHPGAFELKNVPMKRNKFY